MARGIDCRILKSGGETSFRYVQCENCFTPNVTFEGHAPAWCWRCFGTEFVEKDIRHWRCKRTGCDKLHCTYDGKPPVFCDDSSKCLNAGFIEVSPPGN